MLLACETVTNAFNHGRSDARVMGVGLPGVLRVEVADDNSRHPELRAQDPDALDGRLSIVALLAARSGRGRPVPGELGQGGAVPVGPRR